MTTFPKGDRAQAANETEAKPMDGIDEGFSADGEDTWELRLYVAGQTAKSVAAIANLKRFCEQNLKDKYTIEVIDLVKNPQLARDHQILAIPTLVRKLPAPIKKVIGDLSDPEKVIVGMDLLPKG